VHLEPKINTVNIVLQKPKQRLVFCKKVAFFRVTVFATIQKTILMETINESFTLSIILQGIVSPDKYF
jgi:hypothetical protein